MNAPRSDETERARARAGGSFPELPFAFGPAERGVTRLGWLRWVLSRARDYFLAYDPTIWSALPPFVILAALLYLRSPATNFIFDEQEALLANPYVNGAQGLGFLDAIHRDFWGLPPDRSVGSYRPIPNFFWRLLWSVTEAPFVHQLYNVFFHALTGALLVSFTFLVTKRRGVSWLAGTFFVASAILTEAVSGIVGLADVLGGLAALFALLALALPAWSMPFAVFAALLFGLFSKESAIVCVPLVPFAALVLSPFLHPPRPSRWLRALLALAGSVAALVLYVELRKRWFPAPLPAELKVPLPDDASPLKQAARSFLVWFHQAPLPKDPLNNPLAEADVAHRVAGALRVYFRGLVQVVFPRTLSGDYSYPQEPVPDTLYGWETIAGGLLLVFPPVGALGFWAASYRLERRERDGEPLEVGPRTQEARVVAYAMLGIAVGALLAHTVVLRPRGIVPQVRGVPLYWLALPLGLFALGLLAETGKRVRARRQASFRRAGLALLSAFVVWAVVSYFPHSNIPVVLPTVRAERFWYFPVIGTSVVLAVLATALHARAARRKLGGAVSTLVAAFLLFQGAAAYGHAMDYRSDLVFWEATKNAVPRSAKAHLNYSVMRGARQQMGIRLEESRKAIELAPEWPMAHVYTGDTLCRMKRPDEAFPYYERGFDLGPNEMSLIALGLQCLYDEGALERYRDRLTALAEKHPGSWLAYLALDTLNHGDTHKGVDPKYRPRSYNQGPKE